MNSTLLDETGLKLERFDAALAAMLGNDPGRSGSKVLFEARGTTTVELRHWLYCLAKAPGSLLRTRLIDALGKDPDRFVQVIEEGLAGGEAPSGRPVRSLTSNTVSKPVLKMLSRAEQLAPDPKAKVNEAILTTALWEEADAPLQGLLRAWATDEGWEKFMRVVRSRFTVAPELNKESLWDSNKRLRQDLFAATGRRFCRRLREDAASLNATKLTTLHLLYSLLSTESTLLCRTLALRGIDVKKDLLVNLSRQISRSGSKRNMAFELTSDTVLGGVAEVLVNAATGARERGRPAMDEDDISRAFVATQSRTLQEVFPRDKPLDVAAVRDYMDSIEPDEEQRNDGEEDDVRLGIQEITQRIQARIRGQPQALLRVAPWIKRLRFGLLREDRPAAVFLFLGPTGTGKTQMAKELARYVFGSEEKLLFLEMGQFKTKESMNNFVGASPGYVGYGDGKLTNGLRDMPEGVVLFDEIEKADTQVFDTILRFADEGVISDPAGPVRDGRKCIIVMTTNAGQNWLRHHVKANPGALKEPEKLAEQLYGEAIRELEQLKFRPEFIGRVDEKITFLPFSKPTCEEILKDVLEKELAKLRALKEVEIIVDPEACEVLASQAHDRCLEEGARCIPRLINQLIISPAIDLLLTDGDDVSAPRKLHVSRDGLTGVIVEAEES